MREDGESPPFFFLLKKVIIKYMRDRLTPTPEDVASFQAIESGNSSFLKLLEERGAVQHVDGRMVFDEEGLKNLMRRDPEKSWVKAVEFDEIRAGLAGLKGYKKSDLNNPDFQSGRLVPREVLPLPADAQELTTDYPDKTERAVINPWDLAPATKWDKKISLGSGEEVYLAELFMAAQLGGRLKSRRNSEGELEIFDPNENKFTKFTFNGFERAAGKRMQITAPDGKRESLHSGALFAEKYLPNLMKAGVLRREDFRTTSKSRTAEVLGMPEKKIDSNGFIMIGGEGGSMKYYIGKGQEATVVKLDSGLAGIIESRGGRKKLAQTFRLVQPGEIPGRTYINKKGMKDRLQDYDVTQFIPKRADETAEQYAKRVADLNDVQFVTKQFRSFFAAAGIGVHHLPWSEQLVLANAILEERDKNRLIGFAKQYGIEGLRSFLASDYDPKMTGVVLAVGEQAPESAKDIFAKYNQIIDEAKKITDYLMESFRQKSEEISKQNLDRIRDNLLRRAKEFLAKFSQKSLSGSRPESVMTELEGTRSQIVLFSAVFKEMLKTPDFSIREFMTRSVEIKDSTQLNEQERSEMLEVFEAGRRENKYPEGLQQKSIAAFKKVLAEPGHEFTLLTHDGHVMAFVRADKLPSGEIYLGSYNLRQETKGTPLAVILAKDRIEHYGQEADLVADAYEDNPAVPYYTKILGFKITERIENHKGRGQTYVKLLRPRAKRSEERLEQIAA